MGRPIGGGGSEGAGGLVKSFKRENFKTERFDKRKNFEISEFQSFKVLKIQSFKISKF